MVRSTSRPSESTFLSIMACMPSRYAARWLLPNRRPATTTLNRAGLLKTAAWPGCNDTLTRICGDAIAAIPLVVLQLVDQRHNGGDDCRRILASNRSSHELLVVRRHIRPRSDGLSLHRRQIRLDLSQHCPCFSLKSCTSCPCRCSGPLSCARAWSLRRPPAPPHRRQTAAAAARPCQPAEGRWTGQ